VAEEWKNIKISLKDDDVEVYANVPFMGEEGSMKAILTIDDVHKAIKAKGVVKGVMQKEVERIFQESLFDQDVLVASGIPPKHGEDAKIKYFFETKPDFVPKEDEDGRIDYHEVSVLANVKTGDQLCRRTPPTEGTPGRSALDTEIPPKEGRDTAVPQGPNTELSPGDPDLLISSTNGCVSLNPSGLVEVKPRLSIKGNVDFSTGNIDFIGSLVIGGDVKAGFKVKVSGDLEIGGVVEDAEVEVGGEALIKKGFIGKGHGRIKTVGDLTVKFAQNQTIICGGTLNTGGELMHCNGKVGGDVNASGRKAAIIGGEWLIQGSVNAYQLGSVSFTQTMVAVGCDFKLLERKEEINQELLKVDKNRHKVKNALHKLSRLKIKLKGTLPTEQQQLYDRLEETINYYPKYKAELQKEIEQIEAETEKHKSAYVRIGNVLYPGVKVVIGKFPRLFNEKVIRATLREVKGEIVATA